ncbi:M48 family metallopeptidase [Lujinxingia vulgaris]|uniref:M48 family metallopeptidase n=1 Tax=Lujinxingia vulgaris TaxID=2600176 RepID=A0A5C6X1I6_9DELT|nr:SprT family zinc-dependent metalloprotease [Lujinxingia vulgaris]TXD32095.1 M48 family metallopeptidase [Lujinxingia vulgaris]
MPPTAPPHPERDELQIGESTIPYSVRVSARATAKRLEVTPTGVVVIAPRDTPASGPGSVEAFLLKKRRWLYQAVTDLQRREAGGATLPQSWERGAKLMYRGRNLMLEITEADVDKVSIRCPSRFHVEVPRGLTGPRRRAALRHAFHAWLRGRALKDARHFCAHYAARLGSEFVGANFAREQVELGDYQHMWGSCGKDGVLRIHWRLIQAPRVALEYVCAHEVAHLRHRNHDPEFWETLGGLMPDWNAAKEVLERWERETFGGGRGL